MEKHETINKYSEKYSDVSFFSKVLRFGGKAGHELIEKSLQLYYGFRDDSTPKWAKSIILGALGYFIAPIDLLPDVTPIVGFSDDFSIIIAALGAVAINIKDEHKEKAALYANRFFPGKNEIDKAGAEE